MPFEEPLVFQAEWFDSTSGLHRLFNLSFYTSDESVELYDLKTKKLFLRRAPAGYLTKKDLYIGNTVVIYSRHLLIKEFANEYTKNQVEDAKQSMLLLLYPEAHSQIGYILDCLEHAGYTLCRVRSVGFTITTAREFLDRFFVKGQDITEDVHRLNNDAAPSVAFEIVGSNILKHWKSTLRPSVQFEDQDQTDQQQDLNFRGIFGSQTLKDAEWELNFVFGTSTSAISCCVIKPHALRQSLTGRIIQDIQTKGFNIFGIQSFVLTKKEVEDFYEIYKGIPNADYAGMVRQGSTGRCLVLALGQGSIQLTENCPSVVEAFRKTCGPADPEVCRILYPESLRAKYGGLTPEENAIHCSDLEEDGVLEVEYFFTLLQTYNSS